MPRYDFAHPKFNHGFIEFPEKKDSLIDTFMKIAHKYGFHKERERMVSKNKAFTFYNRWSSIEVEGGRFLRNEREIVKFFTDLYRNYIFQKEV